MWCNLLGHGHPQIDAAVREQLDRVAHNTSLGMGNTTTATLAKRLAELAPGNLQHVFFASDGSSAIEAALKMAFQYWRQCDSPRPEKTKYLALGNAYHGDTLYAINTDRLYALPLTPDEDFEITGSDNSVTSGGFLRLFVAEGIAYAIHLRGPSTFDLSDPRQPENIAGSSAGTCCHKDLA